MTNLPVKQTPVPATQNAPLTRPNRKFRTEIPKEHKATIDTRIRWLWNQRFGTVQTIWQQSQTAKGDVLDHTAATLMLQAIMGKDLESIQQIFQRLEGGALTDEALLERAPEQIRLR
jgi:hypothetical protein